MPVVTLGNICSIHEAAKPAIRAGFLHFFGITRE